MRSTLTSLLFVLGLPLLASAQSQPSTQPASTPASQPAPGSQPKKLSPEAEDLIVRTCLSKESSTADKVRIDACQRYLAYFPEGIWVGEVTNRLRGLGVSLGPDSTPTTEESGEIDYSDFAHPRKKGDYSLLIGLGQNSPSGNFGVQLGYYLAPRIQLGPAVGVDDKHLRAGALSRFYLKDSRFSPCATLGLSFSLPRDSTGEATDPITGNVKINQIRLGTSLLAHAGLGLSYRYLTGFSVNVDGGYAQALIDQSITLLEQNAPPLDEPKKVLDGGFFVSVVLGYTF